MKCKYTELAKVKISKARNAVISSYPNGGFTIAQQLEAEENGMKTAVFMRGSLHLSDICALYDLRDAINLSIKLVEDGQWD